MTKKEYQREYHKKWYSKPENARKKKENAAKHRLLKRERNRKFILEYKTNRCCEKCGEEHPVCLDFHHIGDNKEFNISDMVLRCYGIERIQKEIDKCMVVCKNCHAKIHRGD